MGTNGGRYGYKWKEAQKPYAQQTLPMWQRKEVQKVLLE